MAGREESAVQLTSIAFSALVYCRTLAIATRMRRITAGSTKAARSTCWTHCQRRRDWIRDQSWHTTVMTRRCRLSESSTIKRERTSLVSGQYPPLPFMIQENGICNSKRQFTAQYIYLISKTPVSVR